MKSRLIQSMLIFTAAGVTLGLILGLMSLPTYAGEPAVPDQVVTVAGPWTGVEQESFQAVLDEFTLRSGIQVSYTYYAFADLSDFLLNCGASGTCPDVALVSTASLMGQLAELGQLTPLDPIVPDFDSFYTSTWRNLGSVSGTLYGVPFRASEKSIIWYYPPAWEGITTTVPTSWAGLLNLSNALVANGKTPFSIGAESGAASGWPLSDWFENILVRVAGPEVDRKLVTHDIAWTDPSVVESMQRFNDIFGQDDFQLGGITGTLGTNFYTALLDVFTPTHPATMYAQGSWVQDAIAFEFPGLLPVTDYNLFAFPEIDAQFDQPVVGGADFAVLFNNSPDPQSLIQFLATPDAALVWVARGGYLSPNMGVDLNSYPDELTRFQADQLMNANDFLYDLDDQLPPDLQLYIWSALMDYVANPDHLASILKGIEAEATRIQGPVFAVFMPTAMKGSGR